jgi:hypothetical protein
MASGATLEHTNPYAEPTGARLGCFSSPEHPYLSVSTRKFIADSLGPVTMPPRKEPHTRRGGEDSLWATTHEEEDHN